MFNLPDIVNRLAYCRHEYYTHYYYTHITDPHSHPSPISSCKIFRLQNSWILYLLVCIIGSWCWNWGIQKLTLYQHIDSGKAWKSDCKLPQCHFFKNCCDHHKKERGNWKFASKILVAMHDDSAHFHNDLLNKASDAIFVMEIWNKCSKCVYRYINILKPLLYMYVWMHDCD